MQEHEALHRELHDQNRKQSDRTRELVDAGDEKDNRILELEAKLKQKKVNPLVSDMAFQAMIPEL